MKEMEVFSYTPSDLEEVAMNIKKVILEAMVRESVIDEKTKDYWDENTAIILKTPSFWGKILDKEKKEKGYINITMVKRI